MFLASLVRSIKALKKSDRTRRVNKLFARVDIFQLVWKTCISCVHGNCITQFVISASLCANLRLIRIFALILYIIYSCELLNSILFYSIWAPSWFRQVQMTKTSLILVNQTNLIKLGDQQTIQGWFKIGLNVNTALLIMIIFPQ